MGRVLCLPDLHCPAADMYLLKLVADYAKWFKPDTVIQLGDLIDFKRLSRFLSNPEDATTSDEWDETCCQIEQVHKLFPNMIILNGNHDKRLLHRAKEANIPKQLLRQPHQIFNYSGWRYHLSDEPFMYEMIAYIHGDCVNSPLTLLAQRIGCSVIRGHSHKLGLVYTRHFNKVLFAAEAGCIVDVKSPAFAYAAGSASKEMLGFITVDADVPSLIPLC